jgi:hypothetical protein
MHSPDSFRFYVVSPRFYEFGPEGQSPVQEYEVRDRAALHMFGFTENYFVIFANSLQVKPRGTCLLCCGKV